jgi:hypothetical protein
MNAPARKTMSLAEAGRLRLLDGTKLRFHRAGATLRMTLEGEACWLRVRVSRAFPLSEPTRYFSIRDGAKNEIGILADPATLDPDSRCLLEAELERRYVMPVVRRILRVKDRFGVVDWDVETDRGQRTFTTRDLRETVLRSGPGRYIVVDIEDNRYEIPNLYALSPSSQARLLQHL